MAAPVEQRLRDRAGVHELQLAAERHAARDAARLHIPRAQHLGDVMRRGFPFVGEVRGEDHFVDLAVGGALEQPVEADIARADAVERERRPIRTKYIPE